MENPNLEEYVIFENILFCFYFLLIYRSILNAKLQNFKGFFSIRESFMIEREVTESSLRSGVLKLFWWRPLQPFIKIWRP